jgi:hypothetical protein
MNGGSGSEAVAKHQQAAFRRLLGRQLDRKPFMKLRGVNVSESVGILFQETRL